MWVKIRVLDRSQSQRPVVLAQDHKYLCVIAPQDPASSCFWAQARPVSCSYKISKYFRRRIYLPKSTRQRPKQRARPAITSVLLLEIAASLFHSPPGVLHHQHYNLSRHITLLTAPPPPRLLTSPNDPSRRCSSLSQSERTICLYYSIMLRRRREEAESSALGEQRRREDEQRRREEAEESLRPQTL